TGAQVSDVGDRAEDVAEEDQVDPIIPIEREIVDGLVAALAAEEAVELRAFPVALLREGSLSGLRIRAAREIAEARRGIARGEADLQAQRQPVVGEQELVLDHESPLGQRELL